MRKYFARASLFVRPECQTAHQPNATDANNLWNQQKIIWNPFCKSWLVLYYELKVGWNHHHQHQTRTSSGKKLVATFLSMSSSRSNVCSITNIKACHLKKNTCFLFLQALIPAWPTYRKTSCRVLWCVHSHQSLTKLATRQSQQLKWRKEGDDNLVYYEYYLEPTYWACLLLRAWLLVSSLIFKPEATIVHWFECFSNTCHIRSSDFVDAVEYALTCKGCLVI